MECTGGYDKTNFNDSATNIVETMYSESIQEEQVIPGYANFDDYLKEAFDVIRVGIKAANNMPAEENYDYYACFPSFNKAKSKVIDKLLDNMQTIIDISGIPGNIKKRDEDERFEFVQDANDVFLDKANLCMDEESGVAKNPEVELVVSETKKKSTIGSWNVITSPVINRKSNLTSANDVQPTVCLLAGRNVQRPQLTFKDKIDNSSKPWEPRIKDKPNSLKPLAIYLEEGEDGDVFCHPYEWELDRFQPPDNQLKRQEPIRYKALEETPLIVIDKPTDIKILLEDLKKYNEIAIDLEHHSYRSFQGITCLMQISTYDTDYIIDTLTLRSELHELNEILTKPTVLKVFHGSELDIQWLQRDLSLYVVNMFDTYQAAKQLNFPYLSLSYLLKRYCNVNPNKRFQLADWRIRPLPEELLKYAREDTHYLLYIKDVLRNALLEISNGKDNILRIVYDKSTDSCKQTYVKPVWTEKSYMNIYRKSRKIFNSKQLYALRELHNWRDGIARQEDDSIGYVLPNHMLLNIVETLPREVQGILACCNPIPPLVRQNVLKLHKIILTAREQALVKPILEDDLRKRLTQRSQVTNSEAWFYSPHDIPSGMEARADLPCLLDQLNSQVTNNFQTDAEHTITVFDSPPLSEDKESCLLNSNKKKLTFLSPFERYRRVLPMIAEQEERDREEQRKKEEEDLKKKGNEQNDEIQLSINRIHEHFIKVTEKLQQPRPSEAPPVSLGKMHGRKRKKDSNHYEEISRENHDSKIEDKVVINSIRSRKKGKKRSNEKKLRRKGMLPFKTFDYMSVDLSTFQGGSKTNNNSDQAKFKKKTIKNKRKSRKRNKDAISI